VAAAVTPLRGAVDATKTFSNRHHNGWQNAQPIFLWCIARDVFATQKIVAIPTLLEVLCETTGMRFAAVAAPPSPSACRYTCCRNEREHEDQAMSQDFIMIDHPVFFA
jgi:hypothetical protein